MLNLIFNQRCILLGMHFLLHASLISLTNIIHIYVLMDKLLAVDNAVAASSGWSLNTTNPSWTSNRGLDRYPCAKTIQNCLEMRHIYTSFSPEMFILLNVYVWPVQLVQLSQPLVTVGGRSRPNHGTVPLLGHLPSTLNLYYTWTIPGFQGTPPPLLVLSD